MGWDKGIIIDGGELQGELLPYVTEPFVNIARSSYAIVQSEGGGSGQQNDINSIEVDVPYTVGSSIGWTNLAYIAIRDEDDNILRYVCIRYKYSSSIGLGGDQISGDIEIGWLDTGYNYTALGGRGFGANSGDGSGIYPFKLKLHVCISQLTDSLGDYIAFGAVMSVYILNRGTYVYGGAIFSAAAVQGIYPGEIEYSPEYGEGSEPDGYGNGGALGNHDKHSDHSGIPAKPQYGFTSAGFLNHYRISSQGLSMLGEALFPEPASSSPSVEVAIDRLIANQWNSKVLDYVVDCRIIPVTPHDDGLHNISCGGKVLVNPGTMLPYAANLVDEDFVDVDCGYIETPLCEGNFLDFWNLKCKLFLPFYGYVDIEPEYWMGAKIGVYYRFNCMDGSFMCWVTSKAFRSDMDSDDVIGQYSGNACIHLPISSQSYSQIVNGLITTGASVVGAVAGGAAGGKIAGTIASGAAAAITSRPTLNKSNSYSGSSALMSKRTPYLLIEFNEAQFSTKYVEEQGLPAVVKRTLSECEGFTQASNPILDGIPCTEAEKERIRTALASGLIFKNPVTPP